MERPRQFLHFSPNLLNILALCRLLQPLGNCVNSRLLLARYLVAQIRECLLGGVNEALCLVLGLHNFASPLVLLLEPLRLLNHSVNLALREFGRGGDCDRLLLSRALVLCGDI